MISLQIVDTKIFISQLLKSELFDHFLLVEASITTGNTYTIDGKIQSSFYSKEELEESGRTQLTYDYWINFKHICYELIKGKKTPLQLKFVLALSPKNIESIISYAGIQLSASDINGLYLNIQFLENEFHCTTGTSLNIFSLDKSIEHAWDSMVEKFFKKCQIPFSVI